MLNLPPPPDTTRITIATYNIQSGRNSRLEFACRALEKMNVDLCFLMEAKLTDGIHSRACNGYTVTATKAYKYSIMQLARRLAV